MPLVHILGSWFKQQQQTRRIKNLMICNFVFDYSFGIAQFGLITPLTIFTNGQKYVHDTKCIHKALRVLNSYGGKCFPSSIASLRSSITLEVFQKTALSGDALMFYPYAVLCQMWQRIFYNVFATTFSPVCHLICMPEALFKYSLHKKTVIEDDLCRDLEPVWFKTKI